MHLRNSESESAQSAAKVRISHMEKILRGLVKDRLKTVLPLNPRIKELPWACPPLVRTEYDYQVH